MVELAAFGMDKTQAIELTKLVVTKLQSGPNEAAPRPSPAPREPRARQTVPPTVLREALLRACAGAAGVAARLLLQATDAPSRVPIA